MSKIPKTILPGFWQTKTIVMTLLLIGSIATIIWMSVGKFIRVQDTQNQINATVSLGHQVSQLRSQYFNEEPETLEHDLQEADHLLIRDFTHLAQWAQELQDRGNQWNLQMRYRVKKTQQPPGSVQGLALVPLEIQVSTREKESAYRPYLHFIRALEQSGPRVDIQEVTVTGDGQKATNLKIGLSLWMKTRDSVEL